MVRRPLAAVAVAALVVLAGCGGVLGGDSSPANQTTVDVGDTTLPPGVSQDGFSNRTRLVDGHQSALTSSGFAATYELSITLQSQAGTRTQQVSQEVRASAGLSEFRVNATTQQGPRTALTQYWGNATLGLVRTQVANQTTYRKVSESLDRSRRFTFAATLEQLLAVGDYGVTGTETVDGEDRVTLSAQTVNSSLGSGSLGLDAGNVSNVSSTVVVDEQGVVHSFELSFNASGSAGEAYYSVSFDLTGQSDMQVSKPSWVDEARANVTIANLTATLEDGVVAINHEGGDPVPQGALVILQNNGSVYQGSVARSIDAGETVYLALNRSEGTVDLVSTIGNATRISGNASVVMYTQNQQTLLQTTLNASTTDSS